MYVLLVEDDVRLGQVIQKIVSAHYRVDWVRTQEQAKRPKGSIRLGRFRYGAYR
jgi:DNA-binding response OmpR family regulator